MAELQPWVIWIIVGILFLIVEMLTPGLFFFACIGISAVISGLILLWGAPWWLVWVFLFLGSLLLMFASRPLAKYLTREGGLPSNVDSFIGQDGEVIETIEPGLRNGKILVADQEWRARAKEKIDKGERVKITGVDGVHLVVKKKGA